MITWILIGWLLSGVAAALLTINDGINKDKEVAITIEMLSMLLILVVFGPVSLVIILCIILSENKDKVLFTVEKSRKEKKK